MQRAAPGLLTAVAILFMTGQQIAHAQDAKLTLRWVDWYQLFDVGAEDVAAEVQRLFQDLAIDVDWNEDPNLEAPRRTLQLPVLLRPSEPAGLGLPPETMGAVAASKSATPAFRSIAAVCSGDREESCSVARVRRPAACESSSSKYSVNWSAMPFCVWRMRVIRSLVASSYSCCSILNTARLLS